MRHGQKKKKTKTENIAHNRTHGLGLRHTGGGVDYTNNVFLVLKDEKGLLDVYILVIYLTVFITMLAFIMGIGFGALKQAHAKYGYLSECMTFAVEAANMSGKIGAVKENEELVERFFEEAMDEMVGEYKVKKFYAVEEGDAVPGGVAKHSGYIAEVTVPVKELKLPILGEREIEVPMTYFAVTKSEQQF